MMNRLIALAMKHPGLRRVLNAVRFRDLANAWLRRFPLRRHVPASSLSFNVRSLDNLLVAREIFEEGEYDCIRSFPGLRSFADLGCNAGYFTLLAASQGPPQQIVGLAIDANPASVTETLAHISRNQLEHVHAVWGLVGSLSGTSARFFLNVDPAGSSQFDRAPVGNVTMKPWRILDVPVVSIGTEWRERFGDAPCELLKIDIEGSEEAFLRQETRFLSRVSIVVLEVHKWLVSSETIDTLLRSSGFVRSTIVRDSDTVRVVLYLRRDGSYFARGSRA